MEALMKLLESINIAVDNILKNGCSDITKENLEIKIISENKQKYIDYIYRLLNKDEIELDNNFNIHYLLTPKGRYIFDNRKAAILDPIASTCFLATVLQYAEVIESNRIPKEKNIVFSYRININQEDIFDKTVNYGLWRSQTKEKINSGEFEYIVKTDIAGFYDRVSLAKLISNLKRFAVNDSLIKNTEKFIYFWSRNKQYGLPIGNNASRILAEVYLMHIDEYLLKEGIQFTRYVDDYRFFTKNFLEAQRALNKLNLILFEDGLNLNNQKTIISKATREQVENNDKHHEEKAIKVIKEVTQLQGGYNKVVKKFYMPSSNKLEIYQSENIDLLIKNINEKEISSFEEIQRLIISILIQRKFVYLIKICEIIKSNIFALDYFIDMLLKNSDVIPFSSREEIVKFFIKRIDKDFFDFTWQLSLIATLFGTIEYKSINGLLKIIEIEKSKASYATHIALEGLDEKIKKEDLMNLTKDIKSLDKWQQRRLITLLKKTHWKKSEQLETISQEISDDFFTQILLNT